MVGHEIDDIAEQLIVRLLRVDAKCPACGAEMSAKVQKSFMSGARVKCGNCDFYGTWRYGTILHGSRMNNLQFLALFFKYTLPVDAPAIAKELGLDPGTVRQWREKLVAFSRGNQ